MRWNACILAFLSIALLCSCNSVNDDKIPNMPVNINLADAGTWNTFGVSGFGNYRRFLISPREPAGFPFSTQSATGFGGVLLISGMDPYTTQTDAPLAYDLACPVEVKSSIRVEIQGDTFEAVCPVCGSRFDVTMSGGAPVGGPAAESKYKCSLRRYRCIPSGNGGYFITN